MFDDVRKQQSHNHDGDHSDNEQPNQPRRYARLRREHARNRAAHGQNLYPEKCEDRGERSEMQRHVEGEAELGRRLPAKKQPREDEVRGTRNG